MTRPTPPSELMLPPGATVVVTGQQVGLLTGPLLTVLKAARAVSFAAEREAAQRSAAPATAPATPVVPLFWAAADDHDLAEIHHTYILNRKEEAQKFRLDIESARGAASEVAVPTDSATTLVRELFAAAEIDSVKLALDTYLPQPGDSLATWFCRCLGAVLGVHAPRVVLPAQLNAAARGVYDRCATTARSPERWPKVSRPTGRPGSRPRCRWKTTRRCS
jgi:Bacillithiol biosynthesis BshC